MHVEDTPWRGYWVASPTPFASQDALDLPAFRRLLESYLSVGVHGIVVNGSTGEWAAQTVAERQRLLEVAIDAVAGRVPVVVGCSALRIQDSIDLARHGETVGADGYMLTVPPYTHPSQSEAVAFFDDVTSTVPGKWIIYNWPRGVALDLTPATLAQAAGLPGVVGLKDSRPDDAAVKATIELTPAETSIFCRCIEPGMITAVQARPLGFIDGGGLGANFAVEFFESAWSGDVQAAAAAAISYRRLTDSMVNADYSGKFGSPVAQLKAATARRGLPIGAPRSPYQPVTDEHVLAALDEVLSEHAPST